MKQAKSTKPKMFTTWPFSEKKKKNSQALPCTVKPTLTSEGLLRLPRPHSTGSLETSATCAERLSQPQSRQKQALSLPCTQPVSSSRGRCPATATSSQPPSEDLLSGAPALWNHLDQGQAHSTRQFCPIRPPFSPRSP